jgi:glyoxylase-like metal-dependent hydrolase (beta-lactamase superfamily II)
MADASSNGAIAVHAIQTGAVHMKGRQLRPRREAQAARVLDVLLDREWTPSMPISCYLIEHPEGAIVVDTGESSHINDPGYRPWWHPVMRLSARFDVAPDDEAGPQLRARGHDPAAVGKVVMTHMHGDHTGGLSHFPAAQVLVSEREAAAAFARTARVNGYLNEHYPQWLSPTRLTFDGEPWETFDASIALTADGRVRALPTPGHTAGHLSVVVDQGEHLVLLAGDATYAEQQLLDGAIDGVAAEPGAHRDSTARIRELCARRRVVVVPTHDPRGAKRLANVEFTTPQAP